MEMAVFLVVALCSLGKLLPDYTALQPRRQPSSYQPPWEPQILLNNKWTVLLGTLHVRRWILTIIISWQWILARLSSIINSENTISLSHFHSSIVWSMCVQIIITWLVFWVVAPCSLVEVYRHFGGACCLHRPDNGDSKHLWNVSKFLPDYTAQQPRRQSSSYSPPWEPEISLTLESVSENTKMVCVRNRRGKSSVAIQWVVLLTRIREVLGSNLGSETDYSFWLKFFVDFISPSREIPG
jgi:hypothetical protein